VLPEGLEDRYRELRGRPKVADALRADREAAVERTVHATGPGLWAPEVPIPPAANQPPPRLLHEPGDATAGLDASGRAVLVDSVREGTQLLTWDGDRLEIVGFERDKVDRVTWVEHDEAGRPVRFSTAGYGYNKVELWVETVTCEWEGDRCVRALRRVNDHGEAWRDELVEAEYDDHGLVRVLENARAAWRRELHAYEEEPPAPDDALAAWVEAIAAAAARVAERAGAADPAVVKVLPYFQHDSPYVVVVERPYLEAAASRVGAREAIERCSEPRHYLLRELDDGGLRARRALLQQRVWDHHEQPAAAEALLRRLEAMSWPGGAIPVVQGFARHVVGSVEGVVDVPAGRPAPRVEGAPASLDELATLAAGFGLPPELTQQAAWGLVLVGGGGGRSQVGGRPQLPEDMPWPAAGGRPLTHLATIDLAELPGFDDRDLLPGDGVLVFFADLSDEGELWEEVVVGEDDRVRVLHIPPGVPTHKPDSRGVLRRRPVTFRPVLTLPEEPTGLDEAERLSYERLRQLLLDAAPELWEPGHLLLGHPEVVQYDPREPGQVSLLHFGWDEALGFEFLDGGDLTFYGDADDVRSGRWERLTVSPASS
jgi:hypothetical protein